MAAGRAASGTILANHHFRMFREIFEVMSPGVDRFHRACVLFLASASGPDGVDFPANLMRWMSAAALDAEVVDRALNEKFGSGSTEAA